MKTTLEMLEAFFRKTGFVPKYLLPEILWHKDRKSKAAYYRLLTSRDSPTSRVIAVEMSGWPSSWNHGSRRIFMYLHRKHLKGKFWIPLIESYEIKELEEKYPDQASEKTVKEMAKVMNWGGL